MQETGRSIRCLALPLEGREILVPGALVAEVVPYISHSPAEQEEPWMLGRIPWRGLALPLVSFEMAAGLRDAPAVGRRIAVFNTVGGNPALPFYAMFISAVPHLVPLDRQSLTLLDKEDSSALIHGEVEYAADELVVPDIDAFEAMILDGWSQSDTNHASAN